jgi:DNA polymerase III delta prime subunit
MTEEKEKIPVHLVPTMEPEKIPVHPSVQSKLDNFFHSKKIPHIIFHGASGTGKRTIVQDFIHRIYDNDKAKMKSNIMFVNCAHGKGIKFIREELKFFAKSNIQYNQGVLFKTIVLLNADNLTIDAQSALRRCIELFSNNTRFFIIVENKHKLLNPILSRFCEIYIPEYTDDKGHIINLHQYHLKAHHDIEKKEKEEKVSNILYDISAENSHEKRQHKYLANLSVQLYENGYSALDIIHWLRDSNSKTEIILFFHKIKGEYRCEKLLIFFLLDKIFINPVFDMDSNL